VLVHAQGHFSVERLIVEPAGFVERAIDEALRHAVVDHDEKPDVLERGAELGSGDLQRIWGAGDAETEIDHGNRGNCSPRESRVS
jgi:hypothetical protein